MLTRLKILRLGLACVLAVSFLSLLAPMGTSADEATGVILSTAFPSVVADKGKQLTFPMEIANKSQSWQELDLQVTDGPANWSAMLKERGLEVRKVMVAPGKSQTLDFSAKPPENATAQDYGFRVLAVTRGGGVVSELKLDVKLQDKVSTGLKLSTQYPSIGGQAGNSFSFKVDIANDADQDRAISLTANAPENWEVTFKPAYESTQVSTVRVKAASNQGIDVNVTAPQRTGAGEYPINVTASAGTDRAEIQLKAVVVGTNKLALATATGSLTARATVDQNTKVPVTVRNTGTAALDQVTFTSFKPDGWEVTFDPPTIDDLPAGQTKEVNVILKPSAKALAGDYMVSVTASAKQATETKELRVTVETPTLWGWAGVAMIVVVLGGLAGVVGRLSRR